MMMACVTSPKPKCVANRLVKVYKTSPSGSTLVDIARTSENGAWAAHGDFSASFGAKATVVRKTFGRQHHRKVCKSDTDTFGFI